MINELDIIKHAKQYIQSLANCKDPITGEDANENDIIRNERISRCLAYTAEILGKVIENGGISCQKGQFSFTDELIKNIRPSQESVTISAIVGNINDNIDKLSLNRLTGSVVNNWLMEKGFLYNTVVNNRSHKRTTPEGKALGLVEKDFQRDGMTFTAVFYTEKAQQFIIDNIAEICDFAAKEKARRKGENE